MAALSCCIKRAACGRKKSRDNEYQHKNNNRNNLDAVIVALASFVGHILIYGVIWSSGVFYDLFREVFDGPSWMISLIAILSTAFTFGFSPVPGVLINKYGHRIVTMVGGCIAGTGLVLSSYATNMYFLAASFGVITGLGFGTAYLAMIAIIPLYFDKYRTVALGLVVSGVGIGTFIYPPFIRYLVHTYGIRGSLLITGALTYNICVCGAIMQPPRKPCLHNSESAAIEFGSSAEKEKLASISASNGPLSRQNKKSCLSLLNVDIFRNTSFLILCLNNFLGLFGLSIVYVHVATYSETKSVNKDTAAMLVSALGISNFIGRPLFGLLARLSCCSSVLLYAVSFSLGGIAVILMPIMEDFLGIMVLTCVFGFLSASIGPLLPQILTQFIGVDLIPSGYGYLLVFEAFGSLLGPPAAGWLYDILNIYPPSFYLGGAAFGISGAIMIIPYFTRKAEQQSHQHTGITVIDVNLDEMDEAFRSV